MEDKFLYNLKEPLHYFKGGEKLESFQLEVSSPTMQTYKYSSKISQMVMNALMEMRDKAKKEDLELAKENIEKVDMDGKAVKMAMMSSNCDIEKLSNAFIKYCLKNCEIAEGTKIKEETLMTLNPNDFEDLMFGFISFFIMPSLLNLD